MPSISGSVGRCGRCWQPTGQTSRSGSEPRLTILVVSTCALATASASGRASWASGRAAHVEWWTVGPPNGGSRHPRTRLRRASAAGSLSLRPPCRIVPGMARRRWQRPSGQRSVCRMLCATVLGCVVGHGPGSTPSGDDVLVGIFAVLTASRSGAAGAAAARSLDRDDAPALPGTTDISMQLLRQASRGLVGRAVHELICAIFGETNLQALRIAIQRVVETGATSGADTCMGLLAFAPSYFLSDDERAAA